MLSSINILINCSWPVSDHIVRYRPSSHASILLCDHSGRFQAQGVSDSLSVIWAILLARIYEINPLIFPRGGGAMRIMALPCFVGSALS